MRHSIVTQWVQTPSPDGPIYKPKARVDIGLHAPGGQYGDPSGPCYMECEADPVRTTLIESHAETVILRSLDDEGNERTVPSRAVTETKLLAIGMSQRDVDGLKNWNDRERLAEEVKALVK